MKKLFGLLSSTLLVGLISLGTATDIKTNNNDDVVEAPTTLEVKDVLREDLKEDRERTVRKAAAPAAEYVMSDAKIQVTVPDADGTVNVRFVAAIDSFDYESANFTIEMFAENGTTSLGKITRSVTKAYTGIQLGDEVKTAADIFGEGHNYFIAYTLDDMPKDAWENGFKVTTGLKKVEDEDYTTKLTDEVKVVKTAVMADNNLVFDWFPYNNSWGSIQWENDFVAGAVSDLTPDTPDYGDLVTEVVKQNIKAEITTKDGTVWYSSQGTHCSGNADNTKKINIEFINFDTMNTEYSIKVSVTLADGTEIVGVKNYDRLADIINAAVTKTEDERFQLTFDVDSKANDGYEYRIFNNEYEGSFAPATSGMILSTDALVVGTYSVEIVASSNNHAPTSIVLEDVIVIEKAVEILDGSETFDFELYHSGNAHEFVMRFKPLDVADAITDANKINDFKIFRGTEDINANFISWTSNGVSSHQSHPYYDTATGYYTFGFNLHQSPAKDRIYDMTFLVSTDARQVYSVALRFIAYETIAIIESTNAKLYAGLLTATYNEFSPGDYSVENYSELTRIYNEALVGFETVSDEDAKTLYDTTVVAMKEVPAALAEIKFTSAVSASADKDKKAASNAIDGNEESRWETQSEDNKELVVGFNEVHQISKITIFWEGASAKDYNIYVSEDGVTWSASPVYEHRNGSGRRTDTIEFASLVSAKFIKIECVKRATGYGFSIFEIHAFGI